MRRPTSLVLCLQKRMTADSSKQQHKLKHHKQATLSDSYPLGASQQVSPRPLLPFQHIAVIDTTNPIHIWQTPSSVEEILSVIRARHVDLPQKKRPAEPEEMFSKLHENKQLQAILQTKTSQVSNSV